MNAVRPLVVFNAVIFLLLGTSLVLFPYADLVWVGYPFEHQRMPLLACLGLVLGAFGFLVLGLGSLALPGERRRVALRLCIADVLVAGAGLWLALQGVSAGGGLVFLSLVMVAALTASARPRLKLEEAQEIPAVPDEVRRIWLRQVGEVAAQEERNRLARDLHDSIKQQLFTVNVSTAAAQEFWEKNPEKAKAALVDVRRSAREAMVEMQALLHQLQPQALASSGLIEALREQCEALGYRTGAEVLLDLGEAIPDDRLPPGAQETLFRIAQEALSNVARHARARRVRVCLGRDGEFAVLQVADNGQGFNLGEERGGTGLRSLRERAESLHGNLEIDSAPRAGTAITVGIPLTSPPQPPATTAKALQEDWSGALLLPMATMIWLLHLTRPSESWTSTVLSGLYVVILAQYALSLLRRPVAEALPGQASSNLLRFRNHRNAALSFFLAAGIAPWQWRRGEIWVGWTAFWLSAALLAIGLAVFELIRLHRASELRPRWWRLSQFRFGVGGWIFLVISAGFLWLIVVQQWMISFLPHPPPALFQPMEPLEIAFVLVGATILLYVHTRQPRAEGTT